MKRLFILLIVIISALTTRSQNINFNWVNKLERHVGLPVDESYFVGTDASKNVYIAGNFHNSIDLDPGIGVSIVSSQFDNVFISKFSSSGNFIWGKQLGKNDNYTIIKSMSVDAKGNVYTTGYFTGKADFDPGPGVFDLNSVAVNGHENNDVFISRLDANGNFKWAKQIGETNVDIGSSIVADNFGNVYTTGYVTGAVDLDPGPGSFIKGSIDLVTAFITKLDTSGNFKFAKAFEGDHLSTGIYIRTDIKGNIYTSGYYAGTTDFDPGSGVRNLSTGANFSQEDFLSKLDSSGNFIWVIKDIIGLDFAVDDNENVYAYYSLLSKYDSNGNLVWKKPTGGFPNFNYPHNDIQVDHAGNIYLSGQFRYTQDFDPGPAVYNISASGGGYASDVFISKLDNDGNFIYAKAFGGSEEDYATALAINANGDVYTAGVFLQQVDFDPGTDAYNVTASNYGNVFLHKMSPCKNIPPVTLNIVSCKSYKLNNITYDSSGVYTQTLTTNTSCDSVINLNLQINIATSNTLVATCTNYSWNGRLLTASGKHTDTFQTVNGCDSAATIDLVINRITSSINNAICKGQAYNGHTIAGTYTDTFKTANGCDSLATTLLTVLQKPTPLLGADTEICAGDSITLMPGTFTSYQWQDGSTQPAYLVKKPGSYSVTVSNTCGRTTDDIKVLEGICKVYFPNAFTPNNDGVNDRFMLAKASNISDFHISIYNRYGQKVFEAKDYTKAWLGTHKGLPAMPGAYAWYSEFKEAGVVTHLKGTVLLLR